MKQGARASRVCGGEWCAKQTKGEGLLREGNMVTSGNGQKLVKMQNHKNKESGTLEFPLATTKRCDDGQLLLAPEEAPNHSD